MFNPKERAKKLSKAINKKRKDMEYLKKQNKANKQNVKKRWENERNQN
jgi:hypothetical protein